MLKKINQNPIRIVIPILLIIVWLVLASFGAPAFKNINNVINNNQSSFLPNSSQSTSEINAQKKFINTSTFPAVLLFINKAGINSNDIKYLLSLKSKLHNVSGVIISSSNPIEGPILAKNKKAVELIVPTLSKFNSYGAIKALKKLASNHPTDLSFYLTGSGGLIAAFSSAFSGINGILTYVAVAAVLCILLLVYRSILLPIVVLLTSIFGLMAAIFVVYNLAKSNTLIINGESQGILSILVIGASTDYSMLIISRYKEALHKSKSNFESILSAIKVVWEPISAAALTVMIALLMLEFSQLNSNRNLGPVAAIGIMAAYLSALTFLPALLMLFGRKVFWPVKIKAAINDVNAKSLGDSRTWNWVASIIGNKFRPIWLIIAIVLVALGVIGLTSFKASGVSQAQSILYKSRAVEGSNIIGNYFPSGSGSPIQIITNTTNAPMVISLLKANRNIASVNVFSNQFNRKPTIIDGQLLINAVSNYSSFSSNSLNLVSQLRSSLSKIGPGILVGGQSAVQLDTNVAARHDLRLVIPLVLIVIFIILIVLLRSLVAPIVLILSVIISYAATIGVASLVFNYVFHFPGSDPSVPLFGFIFLVALGIDYNIFLMTRIREESKKTPTKKAILKGLSLTGNVLTSAGIVLAATFAALSVIPILFLAEIAFIVSFGVLLDTLIVRSLLVPAICVDIGRPIWWPLAKRLKLK
jgi:RND superfamily putative drug exporter